MTPQSQYKIYTYARELINAVMNELLINQSFTAKEIGWKTTKVGLTMVVFEINQKIKELIEQELESQQECISFNLKNDSTWEAVVSCNGAESYFFARMLYIALARMTSGTVDIKSTNLSIIEQYATKAAIKARLSSFGFIAKANYRHGKYEITVPVNGIQITFADANPDILCKCIGSQLRDFLKSTD